jgi:hypothetical protein
LKDGKPALIPCNQTSTPLAPWPPPARAARAGGELSPLLNPQGDAPDATAVKEAFMFFDKDGKDSLTNEEFTKMVQSLGNASPSPYRAGWPRSTHPGPSTRPNPDAGCSRITARTPRPRRHRRHGCVSSLTEPALHTTSLVLTRSRFCRVEKMMPEIAKEKKSKEDVINAFKVIRSHADSAERLRSLVHFTVDR